MEPSLSFINNIYNQLYEKYLTPYDRYYRGEYHFQEIQQIDTIAVTVILTSNFESNSVTKICLLTDINYTIVSNVVGMNDIILYKSRDFHDALIDSFDSLQLCLYDLYLKLPQFIVSRQTGKIIIVPKDNIDEELNGMYLLGEECSVCFEKTITKTPCNHSLCIHCWNKIGNRNYLLCPICRQQIFLKFHPFLENRPMVDDVTTHESEGNPELEEITFHSDNDTLLSDETENEIRTMNRWISYEEDEETDSIESSNV